MTAPRRLLFAIALAAFVHPALGGDFSEIFSASFKASIDAAMAQKDLDVREQQLNAALSHGSDKETFFVIPLLFPPELIAWADHVDICQSEIERIAVLTGSFYYSSPEDQADFPTVRSREIRADISGLIHCLSRYDVNGALRVPAAQSNNSFKPKPLRGSA